MTYNEAIKLLEREIDRPGSIPLPNLHKALDKGIEAIQYCRIIRQFPHLADKISLPPDSDD